MRHLFSLLLAALLCVACCTTKPAVAPPRPKLGVTQPHMVTLHKAFLWEHTEIMLVAIAAASWNEACGAELISPGPHGTVIVREPPMEVDENGYRTLGLFDGQSDSIAILMPYVYPVSTFYRVVVHELGHSLGLLQHSSDPKSTMYATVAPGQDIGPEDLDRLRALGYSCPGKSKK